MASLFILGCVWAWGGLRVLPAWLRAAGLTWQHQLGIELLSLKCVAVLFTTLCSTCTLSSAVPCLVKLPGMDSCICLVPGAALPMIVDAG